MTKLTGTQLEGLVELAAACDERLRNYGGEGWVRSLDVCGTPEVRSAKNFRELIDLGLAEGKKAGTNKQGQWRWRVTAAGRAVLASGEIG